MCNLIIMREAGPVSRSCESDLVWLFHSNTLTHPLPPPPPTLRLSVCLKPVQSRLDSCFSFLVFSEQLTHIILLAYDKKLQLIAELKKKSILSPLTHIFSRLGTGQYTILSQIVTEKHSGKADRRGFPFSGLRLWQYEIFTTGRGQTRSR